MKRKSGAAAQTASVGNQDMMTFMPNPVAAAVDSNENGTTTTTRTVPTAMGPSSSSSSPRLRSCGGQSQPSRNTDDTENKKNNAVKCETLCDMGNVPDPLLREDDEGEGVGNSLFDREYSLDDEAFDASLDALLRGYDDSCCGVGSVEGGDTQSFVGGVLDATTTMMTATTTADATAVTTSFPPTVLTGGNKDARVGLGRKRKSCGSPAPSSSCSQSFSNVPDPMGNAVQPPQQSTQLNYSARGIVQLPPMFTPQPFSVLTTASGGSSSCSNIMNNFMGCAASAVDNFWTGVGGVQFGTSAQHSQLFDAAVRRGSETQQVSQASQQFPAQVASDMNLVLSSSQAHHSTEMHTNQGQKQSQHSITSSNLLQGTSALPYSSSATAELMSQIKFQPQINSTPQAVGPPPPQPQEQASNPSFQQFHSLPSKSTSNPWDAYRSQLQVNMSINSSGPQQVVSSESQVAVAAAAVGSVTLPPHVETARLMAWGSSISPSHKKSSAIGVSTLPAKVKSSTRRSASLGRDTSTSLAVSEDESDRKSRRSERNLREQERSHRITERITELRTLLSEAGVHFKPDRYSTLVSVVDYIQGLQARSAILDLEHKKLLNTIAVADQLANNQDITPSVGGVGRGDGMTATLQTHCPLENVASSNSSSSTVGHSTSDEEVMVFIQGIDYKTIFSSCGVALAITSVDGRFVDCNEEFLKVTGFSRIELLGNDPRQWNGVLPPHPHSHGGGQGQVVTVSTSVSNNRSTVLATSTAADESATTKITPDFQMSSQLNNSSDFPPPEIITRKQHLSLFNLLSGEDMETVYSAMSQMLRAPKNSAPSISSSSREPSCNANSAKQVSSDPTDESSSSNDSLIKHDKKWITTSEELSSGNEVSKEDNIEGVGGEGSGSGGDGNAGRQSTVDHWTGRVKHTRRKNQMLQLNISLVRTADGRPKFFNCALSEVE